MCVHREVVNYLAWLQYRYQGTIMEDWVEKTGWDQIGLKA
jgi:hypothetical protein